MLELPERIVLEELNIAFTVDLVRSDLKVLSKPSYMLSMLSSPKDLLSSYFADKGLSELYLLRTEGR